MTVGTLIELMGILIIIAIVTIVLVLYENKFPKLKVITLVMWISVMALAAFLLAYFIFLTIIY